MNTLLRSKTSRVALLVTALIGSVAVGFFSSQVLTATPATSATPPLKRVTTEGGLTIVTLDEATQTISGIQSEPIIASKHPVERLVYGTVLDVQG